MAYRDPKVRREKDRERSRKRVAERLAAGLCTRCGRRPPETGRNICGPCTDKRNRASRARDARLRAAGLPRRDVEHARRYERERSRREGNSAAMPVYAFAAARLPPNRSAPCARDVSSGAALRTRRTTRQPRPPAVSTAAKTRPPSVAAPGPPAGSIRKPVSPPAAALAAAGALPSRAARPASLAEARVGSRTMNSTLPGDLPACA